MPRKPNLLRLAQKRYDALLKRRNEIDVELDELRRILSAAEPLPERTKRDV